MKIREFTGQFVIPGGKLDPENMEMIKLRIGEWTGIVVLILVLALSIIGLDTLLREMWG